MTMTRPTGWQVWSDGSSLGNPGPAGWAIQAHRPDGTALILYGSERDRTNNQAEMFALLQAIKAIPEGQAGMIYSDSKHAIGATVTWRAAWEQNGMRTSKRRPVEHQGLVRRLWEEIDKRPGVRLEWVRAHAGNAGNEAVDVVAKKAARLLQAGGEPVSRRRREVAAPSAPAPVADQPHHLSP